MKKIEYELVGKTPGREYSIEDVIKSIEHAKENLITQGCDHLNIRIQFGVDDLFKDILIKIIGDK